MTLAQQQEGGDDAPPDANKDSLPTTTLPNEKGVDTPALPKMTTPMLVLFAGGGCFTACSLYYAQPLLESIRKEFDVSATQISLISTFTQIGYALGLFFIAPMGDMVTRRPLILSLSALVSVFLLIFGFSVNFPMAIVFALFIGLSSVSIQILVPFAVDLSEPSKRGRTVGIIMSGIFLGALLSRTISGVLGNWLGWRAVFWCASVVMAIVTTIFFFTVPNVKPHNKVKYHELLWSILLLLRRHPVLCQCCFIGAMIFGAFQSLWTTLTFRLSTTPYFYSSAIIGLFGLVGAAGVVAAPLAGILADKRGPYFTIGLALTVIVGSFVILATCDDYLAALIIAIFVCDMAVQSAQVSNQSRVFALDPKARSRLNGVYVVCYFIGGAVGSELGGWAFDHHGWVASCIVSFIALGLAMIVYISRRPQPGDPTPTPPPPPPQKIETVDLSSQLKNVNQNGSEDIISADSVVVLHKNEPSLSSTPLTTAATTTTATATTTTATSSVTLDINTSSTRSDTL